MLGWTLVWRKPNPWVRRLDDSEDEEVQREDAHATKMLQAATTRRSGLLSLGSAAEVFTMCVQNQ